MNYDAVTPPKTTLFLEACARRRQFIYLFTFASLAIAATTAFLMPNRYTASVLLLPPAQSSGLAGAVLGQMAPGMANLAGGLLDMSSAADTYVGILKSKRVMDGVIDRHHLKDVYGEQYRLKLYRELEKNVDVWVGKREGIINIDVTDEDPRRAAEMANTFTAELNKVTAEMASGSSNEDTEFYTGQLDKARKNMDELQARLRKFQAANQVLDVPEHAKASMTALLELKAQLVLQQSRLASLQRQLTDDNPEIKTLKGSIASIVKRISDLETGSGSGVLPSVNRASAMSQEYLTLLREFKVQEAVYDLVRKQLEVSKMSGSKSSTSAQVLQKASVPDYKSGPKRGIIIACATMTGFFISLLCVFVSACFDEMPPEKRRHLTALLGRLFFVVKRES